jgi:hypothetical protein
MVPVDFSCRQLCGRLLLADSVEKQRIADAESGR